MEYDQMLPTTWYGCYLPQAHHDLSEIPEALVRGKLNLEAISFFVFFSLFLWACEQMTEPITVFYPVAWMLLWKDQQSCDMSMYNMGVYSTVNSQNFCFVFFFQQNIKSNSSIKNLCCMQHQAYDRFFFSIQNIATVFLYIERKRETLLQLIL